MAINFELLVESLLTESLQNDLISKVPQGASSQNTPLKDAAEWALKILKSSGQSYLKVDTLLAVKPLWPLIDTLAYIFKSLLDNKIIPTLNDVFVNEFLNNLKNSNVNTIVDYFANSNISSQTILKAFNNNTNSEQQFYDNLQAKIDDYKTNANNYRNWFLPRLKQMQDKTQIIAAEKYLPLTPYNGLTQLLKEYGGYDMRLVDNILKYPAETKFTQQSNIEGPVMGSVIEIAKLLLVFYRDYFINADSNIKQTLIQTVGVADENALIAATNNSAGKLTASNKVLQQDFINFIQGNSKLILDPTTQKSLIEKINDFQGLTNTGQEIFQSFLYVFNNIKKGTVPSKWQVANKMLSDFTKGLEDIGSALERF
jgi:hypothetical protein